MIHFRVSAKGDRGGPWTPPIFFPEKSGFLQGFGGDHGPPQENGVLEVVDDPPWSCDPTVQSIWLAVPEEVEEKVVQSFLKRVKVAYRAPAALCC